MDKPLAGRTVVITRSENQAGVLVQKIENLGGRAVVFPTIEIRDPESWQDCDNAIRTGQTFDWIVFSSANAVYYFYRRAGKFDITSLPGKVAAVGKKTAETLKRLNVRVDLMPEEFSARALLEEFEDHDLVRKRILIPTSNIGRAELEDGLRGMGAIVERVVAYETVPNRSLDTNSMSRFIKNGEIDCFAFFSPSAFDNFLVLMGESVIKDIRENSVAIASIGPTTAKAVVGRGLDITIQPARSLENDLVDALVAFYSGD